MTITGPIEPPRSTFRVFLTSCSYSSLDRWVLSRFQILSTSGGPRAAVWETLWLPRNVGYLASPAAQLQSRQPEDVYRASGGEDARVGLEIMTPLVLKAPLHMPNPYKQPLNLNRCAISTRPWVSGGFVLGLGSSGSEVAVVWVAVWFCFSPVSGAFPVFERGSG